MLIHSGQASVQERQPPRFWRFMSRLGNWQWEWSLGIHVGYDGEIDGSGIMLRVDLPSWIAAPIHGWTYRHMPEWMKKNAREDISDVLLSSPLTPTLLPTVTQGDFSGVGVTWVEDQLNG